MKIDVSNVLPGDHISAHHAAAWLRQHMNIPPNCTVVEQFEQYFNCRINIADPLDPWMQPDNIVFETGADLLAFVLKWS